MQNKKSIKRAIFSLLLIALFVTACSSKRPITKKDLNNQYDVTISILVDAHKQVDSKNKYIHLDGQQRSNIKNFLKKLNTSQTVVNSGRKTAASYPKDLLAYQQSTQKYLTTLLREKSKKQAQEDFHLAVEKAYFINTRYQNKTNKNLNTALVLDQEGMSKRQPALEKKKVKNNKVSLGKSSKKIKAINFSLGWIIWFVFISAVIIMSVFLQPNKSNDNMSALESSGGANLYNRPKTKGYQLFLQRLTEISVVILVLSLVLFH